MLDLIPLRAPKSPEWARVVVVPVSDMVSNPDVMIVGAGVAGLVSRHSIRA